MHDLMFQAGVKGMSERSKLIPCIEYMCCTEVGIMSMHTYVLQCQGRRNRSGRSDQNRTTF